MLRRALHALPPIKPPLHHVRVFSDNNPAPPNYVAPSAHPSNHPDSHQRNQTTTLGHADEQDWANFKPPVAPDGPPAAQRIAVERTESDLLKEIEHLERKARSVQAAREEDAIEYFARKARRSMAVLTFKLMAAFGHRLAGMESLRRAKYADLEKAAAAARSAYAQDPRDTSFLPDSAFADVYISIAQLDSKLARALRFLHNPFASPDQLERARDFVSYQAPSAEELESYLVDPDAVRLTPHSPELFERLKRDEAERGRVLECWESLCERFGWGEYADDEEDDW